MSHGKVARLRVLAMLVAFGIGLVGQLVAAVAIPMPMSVPISQTAIASGSGDTDSGGCAGCPGQKHAPASPAMASSCLSVFCSALPAVLPVGPVAVPVAHARFHPVVARSDAGIAVRPDLGPPKPIRHS